MAAKRAPAGHCGDGGLDLVDGVDPSGAPTPSWLI
jgi:hypothetical protein